MFFLHVQAIVRTTKILGKSLLTCHQYNIASLVFSWFALANIWLTFSIIIDLLPSQGVTIFGTAAIVSFRFVLSLFTYSGWSH